MTVGALVDADHTVYAGMRLIETRNRPAAATATAYATERGVDLRPVELDVSVQTSVDAAVTKVLDEVGSTDVVVLRATTLPSTEGS